MILTVLAYLWLNVIKGIKLINKQNPEAKVQALSNMNSKALDHASTGGEEFKAYALIIGNTYTQWFSWDGLVPTSDVIDAAHRNGVPIYGTLFFNWSSSARIRNDLQRL